MKEVKNAVLPWVALICLFSATSANVWAKEIWVSKSGSDSNGCTNKISDACLTIQRGINLAVAGDTVNIVRGKYVENSANTSKACSWLDGRIASLCVSQSGTASSPIVIQAAPGDERQVFIDSEGLRVGLHTLASDYIHIKGLVFVNNNTVGLAHWGQTANAVPDPDLLGVGIVVEGNSFLNTTGPAGENVAAIGMWGSKDWIVRNNYISGVSVAGGFNASGIQAYGVINALIENNYITNVIMGIYWKDHFVKSVTDRGTWFESEIRYNVIDATYAGVNIGIRGSKSPEAGSSYIHHNIIYGLKTDNAGILATMSGAYGISAPLRIEHNLIDGEGLNTRAIALDGIESATLKGNISTRTAIDLELSTYSDSRSVQLKASDYNVFDSTPVVVADRYSPTTTARTFSSLPSWQGALDLGLLTLAFDRPDTKSITASPTQLFENISNRNYAYKTTSSAKGMMPGGTNAGPYELGNEVIGLLTPIKDDRPKPPLPQ